MPQKLIDVLRLGRVSHEFSWPRRAADGHYYQVCLLCATEYKYDWDTMRRTERVPLTAAEPATRRRTREKKPSWVPRARRLKLSVPLRYRVKNLSTWSEGTILNISQSGVLFEGSAELPVNALVEMVFDMPEEISGRRTATFSARARSSAPKGLRARNPTPAWRPRSSTTNSCTRAKRSSPDARPRLWFWPTYYRHRWCNGE